MWSFFFKHPPLAPPRISYIRDWTLTFGFYLYSRQVNYYLKKKKMIYNDTTTGIEIIFFLCYWGALYIIIRQRRVIRFIISLRNELARTS